MERIGRDDGLPVWFARRPTRQARTWVSSFHGYRVDVADGTEHLAVPQAGLPLIFSLGPDHVLRDPGAPDVHRVGAFLAGLSARATHVAAEQFVGIQVDLTPVGAYRLVGHDLAELVDHSVPVGDVLGRDADDLRHQLVAVDDWDLRADLVRDYLRRRLEAGRAPRPELVEAWDRLAHTRGRLRIADLAAELGLSARHLTRQFRAAFGLTPKAAARVVRFQQVADVLTRPPPEASIDLAALAHRAGYADQAHLANEVRDLTGRTPTQLLAASRGGRGAYVDAG